MSVVAFGALALTMWAMRPAALAAPVPLYLMSVWIVHAASAAVSGCPSLHFAFATVVNVQVLPSCDVFHERAKSGAKFAFFWSYWMRSGYMYSNAEIASWLKATYG